MYYLAVDIGATSGRVMLGTLKNGKIKTEELHRFGNGTVERGGHLCWQVDRLFAEIKEGMKKCAARGIKPRSMAVDCFAVDFALLDKDGNLVGDTVSYRDPRTEGMPEKAAVSLETFYKRSGMVGGDISSVFQLLYLKQETDQLKKAVRFLHLPDYINYLLTGVAVNEYAVSQTSLLVNAETGEFDGEILRALDLPAELFRKPMPAGTVVGRVKPEIFAETGVDCDVVLAASHDTVSAAVAVPSAEDCVFLSSGTWSMLGAYVSKPVFSSGDIRFSNMKIDDGRYGLIQGFTGLFMITAIKRELEDKYTYDELCEMAAASNYPDIVDVSDNAFSAPHSMLEAMRTYAKEHGLSPMETLGDVLHCIYRSLAVQYAKYIKVLEDIAGKQYEALYIVGGGSRDWYLNKLTAEETSKKVYAGPVEATAIGNIAAQLKAAGVFSTLWDAKKAVETPTPVY